jgi:hypothetical protein
MMPDLDEIHDRYICNLVEIYVLLHDSRRDLIRNCNIMSPYGYFGRSWGVALDKLRVLC